MQRHAEKAGARTKKIDFTAVERRLHNNNMWRAMRGQTTGT
jgi:hypothetical protein